MTNQTRFLLSRSAHKIYLQSSSDQKAFLKFSQIVENLTQDFKRISQDIIKIEKDLRETFNANQLSSWIREVQNYEMTKLQLTAQLQIKKKEQKDSPCDEIDDTISSLNQRYELLAYEPFIWIRMADPPIILLTSYLIQLTLFFHSLCLDFPPPNAA